MTAAELQSLYDTARKDPVTGCRWCQKGMHMGGGRDVVDIIPCTFPPILEWCAARITELESANRVLREALDSVDGLCREIAFFVPTVCYEHDDRRYSDIEDVFKLKVAAVSVRTIIDAARDRKEQG